MKTFTVTRRLNDWNLRGDSCNVRTSVLFTTTDPVKAAVAISTGHTYRAKDNEQTDVADETGAALQMIDLYALVVGPEVFAAQLADEGFSINLDHYFRDLAASVEAARGEFPVA